MGTTNKGLIGKEDLSIYDGLSTGFTRKTSSGGTATYTKLDWFGVDVQYEFGARDAAAINSAIDQIGSTTSEIFLGPGAWSIDADVTVPSNITLTISPAATISVDSGKTLTVNGPIRQLISDPFSGDGTVAFGGNSKHIYSNLSDTATSYYPTRAPLFIWSDPSSNSAGQNAGLQVWVNEDLTATPASGDHIAGTFYISNLNSRQHIWGLNVAALPDASGTEGNVRGIEVEVANTSGTDGTNPYGGAGYFQVGVDIAGHNGSTDRPVSAVKVWANDTTGEKWWHEGISLSRCYKYGIHFYADPGGSTDDVDAFGAVAGAAAIYDESNSDAILKTTTTHANGVIDLGDITGGDETEYLFCRPSGNGHSDLIYRNYVDYNLAIAIDSGVSTACEATLRLKDQGTSKWAITKDSSNQLIIYDHATGRTVVLIDTDANNPCYLFIDGGVAKVQAGAADSGGGGYKMLRIEN